MIYNTKKYKFETNGGSAVSNIVKEVSESPVTTYDGKVFPGWYDNAEFKGNAITFPYSGEKTTLYAKWGAKITFIDDFSGEQTVDLGQDAVLPTPPIGYIYKFTVNDKAWDGKNITENTTVTVTKLHDKCDIVDINDCYDIIARNGSVTASTYFCTLDFGKISVSDGAYARVYAGEACSKPIGSITTTENSAVTVYIAVTAESGRSEIHKVQLTHTPVTDLGGIEFINAAGGHITLKLKNAVPGNPKILVATSKDGVDYTYTEAEYNPESRLIQLSGLDEQTKYFAKAAADYRKASAPYAESRVIELTTGKTYSSDCSIISIISPPDAEYDLKNGIITAAVSNVFSEYQINLEVSDGATWGVYRTASAKLPVSGNKLTLTEGRTTTAYIKVVAEDGYSTKTYTIKIYRQRKSALPKISLVDGKVAITAPEGSTILYTTDNADPIPGVSGKTYTEPFSAAADSVIKAIALNPGIEEYSDIAIFRIAQNTEITAENLSLYVSGKKVDFEYYLIATDESDLNGTFYLAAYNESGRLVGLYKEDVNESFSEYDLSSTMTVNEAPAYFKAFFWNGLKPLRNNVTKDIPQ